MHDRLPFHLQWSWEGGRVRVLRASLTRFVRVTGFTGCCIGRDVQLVGPCNLSCTILPLYESVDFQEPLGRDGSELGARQR